jgi:methanogenic corrinoid protein MtbC1
LAKRQYLIGTVAGDLHDFGNKPCRSHIESAGFEVIDLVLTTLPTKFVDAIKAKPTAKVSELPLF